MGSTASGSTASIENIDQSEALLRRDLAACYRLVALFGWDDLVATHISVRLPDDRGFLINPFGMMFEEIRPADLINVDMEGNLLHPTKWQVNHAGFAIHSAIHASRHDARCIIHLHTDDGVAVSMLEQGLLMLNQTAMLVAGQIAFHEYEGAAALGERARLAADLGDKSVMFLRNHGTLAVGGTVAEAFTTMYFLEKACTIQVRALGMGRSIHPVRPEVVELFSTMPSEGRLAALAQNTVWPAMLRKLDRTDPSWRG
jgi:ribulose-5-phosphate 4-epimerase/fuculose-1-phosphate aldolase